MNAIIAMNSDDVESDVRLLWLTGCALIFRCVALAVDIFAIDSTDRKKQARDENEKLQLDR